MAREIDDLVAELKVLAKDLVEDADTRIDGSNALETALTVIRLLQAEAGRVGDAVAASLGSERAGLIFSRAREQAKAELSPAEIEKAAERAYGK